MEVNTAYLASYKQRPDWMMAPETKDLANPFDVGTTDVTEDILVNPTHADVNQASTWQIGDYVSTSIDGQKKSRHIMYTFENRAFVKGEGWQEWIDFKDLTAALHPTEQLNTTPVKQLPKPRKRKTTRIANRGHTLLTLCAGDK